MAKTEEEPQKNYFGMDITVGALQVEKKEIKKGLRAADGLSLGSNEFFHGIPPQWKFLDEKYFEKWEKKQVEYRQRLEVIRKTRTKRHSLTSSNTHNQLMSMAGPEWYQELAPQQKELLENLKTYIKKDLDIHLTKETKSRLSLLGMRPLPNDGQIWRALTKSFGCPVEFLLEPVKLRSCDDLYEEDRTDENLKLPCEVFEDHLVAEDYYNLMFKRKDTSKYILLRPKLYETTTPKIHPGILPPSLLPKQYPTPIKLIFDVKIYDEIDPRNQKKNKMIRIICEVRERPGGRPGQTAAQNLFARYVERMSVENYLKKGSDSNVVELYGHDYSCSVCGGSEKKAEPSEMKPIKQKSWIKRPHHKKKREMIYTNLSEYMNSEELKVVSIDAKSKKLIQENQEYVEKWNKLFENIKQMEKLVLESGKCTCPGKGGDKSRLDTEMDCTCAVWNLPTPPKSTPSKISCECKPKLEEESSFGPPKEDKCDCKQKAREAAMEKCEKCGKSNTKTDEQLADRGECECTKKLEGCGNCAKETPMKFPLLQDEAKKECDCTNKLPEGGKEVTVAYVFIDNKIQGGFPNSTKNETCECKASIQLNKEDGSFKKKCKAEGKKQENDTQKKVAVCKDKHGKIARQFGRQDSESSAERSKIFELDRCRGEAEKLLDMLKCSCSKCKELRRKHRNRYYRAGTRDGCGGPIPVIEGVYGSEKECDCLKKFGERVKFVQDYKQRMKAKVDLKSKKHQYIISGVKQTTKGPIYNIAGVIPKKPCICKTQEEILREKQKGEKFSTSLRPGYKHVISGVRGGQGSLEYIINGASKECDCTGVYERFMDEHNECLVSYERYLTYMQKEIEAYMEDVQERYKDPPLSARELMENDIKRMTGAPGIPLPQGKSDFIISGVRENEVGKNFVLGGLPLRPRDREERVIRVESYTRFADREAELPTKCQKLFLCNYVTIGKDCGNPFQQTKEIYIKNSSEEIICRCISYGSLESISVENEQDEEEEEEGQDGCACECPCGIEIKQPEGCSCAEEKEKSEEDCVCPKSSEAEEEDEVEPPEGCTCGYVSPESSGTASDPCLCGVKNCGCNVDAVCVKECFYGPMEAWWSSHEVTQEYKGDKDGTPNDNESTDLRTAYGGPSRRYVIFKEIPKATKDQRKFLQKLLKGLADDGYPIALLPDVYKLPYFKLWLQFRMRKKWNYDDGVRNYKKCRELWNHISVCKRTMPKPKLPIHCVCEAKTYTWKDADKASRIVAQAKRKFYGKIRENMLDYAREFYTTIYPYRYPNPPYLNHYFYAYQPAKVENVLAEYIWEG